MCCHFYEIISGYSGLADNLLKWKLDFDMTLQNNRRNTYFIDNITFLTGQWLKNNFICLAHSILANVYVLTIISGL